MTETPPEPGVRARAEEWLQDHLAPDLATLKADVGRFRELIPELSKLAGAVADLAKADPGIPPQIVAEVEEAAEVVARIAGELAAGGM